MTCDYLFCGLGMSAMVVLRELDAHGLLEGKKIIVLEQQPQIEERFWCFWEQGDGLWDGLLSGRWNNARVTDGALQKEVLDGLTYKCIRSGDMRQITNQLLGRKGAEIRLETMTDWTDAGKQVHVRTQANQYTTQFLINSAAAPSAITKPVLLQHFEGWLVRSCPGTFDATTATLMDFSVAQKGNTRFMYVLPFSDDTALVEYTLFSPDLIEPQQYDAAIADYLRERGIFDYSIIGKEKGVVPMTAHRFWDANTKNTLHIGTAGGWTKASSGYTFLKATRLARQLAEMLQQPSVDFSHFYRPTRFDWYDRLLIDVLYRDNALGKELFTRLFFNTRPGVVMRFLAESTTWTEELPVLWTCPKKPFLAALTRL